MIQYNQKEEREEIFMNLKEAFRYMNYLKDAQEKFTNFLYNDDIVTKTKETHLRNKKNPEGTDEVIEDAKPSPIEYSVDDILKTLDAIFGEMEIVSNLISKAKRETEIDIDEAIAMNKRKQYTLSALRRLSSLKASERKDRGFDYKLNAEGNQTPYYYDIECVQTINYDRNEVKARLKALTKETDEISSKVDRITITMELDFEPIWDFDDMVEDMIEKVIHREEPKKDKKKKK